MKAERTDGGGRGLLILRGSDADVVAQARRRLEATRRTMEALSHRLSDLRARERQFAALLERLEQEIEPEL